MSIDVQEQPQPSYEVLLAENLALRHKVETVQGENQAVWRLLVETNRRLQLLSAAIKASVSSLLTYDIFWDDTNQHEFLETINSSIDQVGSLINLLALTFRVRAGNLEFRYEAQALPEILSVVQDHVARRRGNLALKLALPPDGKPVWVNYEYLILAIEFLLAAAEQTGARQMQLEAGEGADSWRLDLTGMPAPCLAFVQGLLKDSDSQLAHSEELAPDYQLRLFLAYHLLRQQGIQVEIAEPAADPNSLHLRIPVQTSR